MSALEPEKICPHCDRTAEQIRSTLAPGEVLYACRPCERFLVGEEWWRFIYGNCVACGAPIIKTPAELCNHHCDPATESRIEAARLGVGERAVETRSPDGWIRDLELDE